MFSLVIEDDPSDEFKKCIPVQPQGRLSKNDAIDLGLKLYKLGIKEHLWSEKSVIFFAPVCIGLGELSDPNLPLQELFCGVSSSLYRIGNPDAGIYLFDPSIMDTDAINDLWKMIINSKPLVEPPYCIPFTVFDSSNKFQWARGKFSKQTIQAFNQLGKETYGVGATAIPLPVDCSGARAL